MYFTAAGLTDVGLEREHNEDSFCILSEQRVFIVADGMGGHQAGDVASQMTTRTITKFFAALTVSPSETTHTQHIQHIQDGITDVVCDAGQLVTSVQTANQRIFEMSTKYRDLAGMGTTVVGALHRPDTGELCIAHVGDSRAYRVRHDAIEQLTADHSLVNEYLAAAPHIDQAHLDELPTNVITRALGIQPDVEVDLTIDTPQQGDWYLLCSDGLTDMLSDKQILATLSDASCLETAAQRLVHTANQHGGIDNITVVLLNFHSGQ